MKLKGAYFFEFLILIILVMFMKSLKAYLVWGVIFVYVLGTLFHFVYEWSGNNFFIGLFAPIDESVWEHTKLIFFPMALYSFYLSKKLKGRYLNIDSAMILGEILGIVLIISLFYTYSGAIGFNVAFIDILIFYISVALSFYIVYKLTIHSKLSKYIIPLKVVQFLILCLFIIFTLFKPQIPLFIEL